MYPVGVGPDARDQRTVLLALGLGWCCISYLTIDADRVDL